VFQFKIQTGKHPKQTMILGYNLYLAWIILLMDKARIILGKVNIAPLLKVQSQFDHALLNTKDQLDRTGAIKLFEMCYELSWKTLKRILEAKGLREVLNPKDVFRVSADQGLIDNPEEWFAFHETRNLTVHTYNESVAISIFEQLDDFQILLSQLVERISTL
jgi:nucleotidyltransferase substrate binding protein (TIGR01987 family)